MFLAIKHTDVWQIRRREIPTGVLFVLRSRAAYDVTVSAESKSQQVMTMNISRRDFIQTSAAMAAYLGLDPTLRAAPNGDELTFLTISELSELIRTKKISPLEITRLMLQRIDKFNPVLNAYITVTSEQAMKSAQDAEKEIQQGKWRGPLHGVPVALKDLFDTAGVRTTAASGVFKDRVPNQDAEVVS
jgi:hypothetical protein